MMWKFKPGDKVQVIKSGCGFTDQYLGKILTISEIGLYTGTQPGYRIVEEENNINIGNVYYDGYLGEESFELYKLKCDILIDEILETLEKYET